MAFTYVGTNLYVTDEAKNIASKALSLDECGFPELTRVTADKDSAGALGKIQVDTGKLEELVFPFKLIGFDPHTMSQFGLGANNRTHYTVYAQLKDDITGQEQDIMCRMFGQMKSAKTDAMKAGELGNSDFEVVSIIEYELVVGGDELFFYDYKNSIWRVNGVDENANRRAALRL